MAALTASRMGAPLGFTAPPRAGWVSPQAVAASPRSPSSSSGSSRSSSSSSQGQSQARVNSPFAAGNVRYSTPPPGVRRPPNSGTPVTPPQEGLAPKPHGGWPSQAMEGTFPRAPPAGFTRTASPFRTSPQGPGGFAGKRFQVAGTDHFHDSETRAAAPASPRSAAVPRLPLGSASPPVAQAFRSPQHDDTAGEVRKFPPQQFAPPPQFFSPRRSLSPGAAKQSPAPEGRGFQPSRMPNPVGAASPWPKAGGVGRTVASHGSRWPEATANGGSPAFTPATEKSQAHRFGPQARPAIAPGGKPTSGSGSKPFGPASRSSGWRMPGTALSAATSRFFRGPSSSETEARKREQERRVAQGVEVFNANPKKSLSALQALEIVPSPPTPESMASFLREAPDLEKRAVGEYLAERHEFEGQVRDAFMKLLALDGLSVVESVRLCLSCFRLPGEAQQIERLMESFAAAYFSAQPEVSKGGQPRWVPYERGSSAQEQGFDHAALTGCVPVASTDTIFVLSYSIIMLNTDLHNPRVKAKMSLEGFIRNNRGIDGGKDLPPEYLQSIYDAIKEEEIILPGEREKLVDDKPQEGTATPRAESKSPRSGEGNPDVSKLHSLRLLGTKYLEMQKTRIRELKDHLRQITPRGPQVTFAKSSSVRFYDGEE